MFHIRALSNTYIIQ